MGIIKCTSFFDQFHLFSVMSYKVTCNLFEGCFEETVEDLNEISSNKDDIASGVL